MNIKEVKREVVFRRVDATVVLDIEGKQLTIDRTVIYDSSEAEDSWTPQTPQDVAMVEAMTEEDRDDLDDFIRGEVNI